MSDSLSRCFKQVVIAQAVLLFAGALIAAVVFGRIEAYAFMVGAVLSMLNTLLARRSIRRSSELAYRQPDASMLPVFSGLLQRLILFAAGFSGGVLMLGLPPLLILAGFAITQIGYLACKMR